MTQRIWPEQLEVDFVPEALHRERMAALRGQRIAAWGWLGLSILAAALILIPLTHARGLQLLAAVWAVLWAGMVFVTVKTFVVLAWCSVWLAGLPTYSWSSIRDLRIHSTLGRRYLIVDLEPGTEPDTPTVAGLNELRPPAPHRLPLTPRGPRLLLRTLALSPDDLRTAARHYSTDNSGAGH